MIIHKQIACEAKDDVGIKPILLLRLPVVNISPVLGTIMQKYSGVNSKQYVNIKTKHCKVINNSRLLNSLNV